LACAGLETRRRRALCNRFAEPNNDIGRAASWAVGAFLDRLRNQEMSSTVNDVASSNTERDAVRIAERVAEAWHSVDHSGRLDVPMSVVAAIATVSVTSADGQDLTEPLTAWITADVAEFARTVWARFLTGRSDLAAPLYPMIAWLYPQPHNHPDPGNNHSDSEAGEEGEPSPELVSRAQTVATAALRAGQLPLSGTQRRLETNLLGITRTGLRPRSALRTRGQFYTPAAAAEVMAAMLGVSEHASVSDPAMGTGGTFRAAASAMRARGMSPAGMPAAGPCSSSSNCSPRHTETPRPGPNHIPIPAPNPPGATARQVQRDRVRPGYRTEARAHGQ
jgi:hypothetical protein